MDLPERSNWKIIGRGRFAKVFETYNIKNGDKVAVKETIIGNELLNMSELEKTIFNKEVEILTQLGLIYTSPYILELLGTIYDTEPWCIVTPLMSGGTLYNKINDGKEFALEKRLSIAGDITQGLKHLHNHNIIHRGIKSPNILLDDKLGAKIGGFGLAINTKSIEHKELDLYKFYDPEEESSNSILSIAWTAPEIFLNRSNYSEKSDIYGLGIILWELSIRTLPYKSLTDEAILIDLLLEGNRMGFEGAELPQLQTLTEECWAENPDDRPTEDYIMKSLNDITEDFYLSKSPDV